MSGLNSLYRTQYSQEKVAADNSAAIQRQLAKIAIASNRDEKAAVASQKTAAETGIGYVTNADEDKFHSILMGAQGMVAQNQMKPGAIHTVGLDQGAGDMGAGGAGSAEQAEEGLKMASYLALVQHVKFAANRSDELQPVACFVCNTAGAKTAAAGSSFCGVCDNLGYMPKFAAERGLAFADAYSDYLAAGALAKEAAAVAEAMGQDSVDFGRAQQESMQAQQIVDSNFQGMLGHPPVGTPDWGGLHISQNPTWTMLQPTLGKTY
jgi:hypothetical protein